MRELSAREKIIVKKICEGTGHIAQLINFTDFSGYILKFELDHYTGNYKVAVLFHTSIAHTALQSDYEKFLIEIAQTINLVNYLIQENYIFVIKPSHGIPSLSHSGSVKELERFNSDQGNSYSFQMHFTDIDIQPYLLSLIDKRIIATNALEEFYKNDYRTKSDIYNQRNITISILALVTAILLGIISICLQIDFDSWCNS